MSKLYSLRNTPSCTHKCYDNIKIVFFTKHFVTEIFFYLNSYYVLKDHVNHAVRSKTVYALSVWMCYTKVTLYMHALAVYLALLYGI